MPEPDKPPATTGDDEATESADAGEHKPDGFAISPAIGPLPAIYVPQSPSKSSAAGLFWHAEAQAARQARSRAACHLPLHGPECRAHDSPAADAPPTVPMANSREEQ
jgi:hypothetical protein